MPQQDVDSPTGSHELGFEALRLLAQLARADGVVDAREREVLQQFARALGLSPSSADAALQAAPGRPDSALLRRFDEATCAATLRRAHQVLVADGVFDQRERARFERILERLVASRVTRNELIQDAERGVIVERSTRRWRWATIAAFLAAAVAGSALFAGRESFWHGRAVHAGLQDVASSIEGHVVYVCVSYRVVRSGETAPRADEAPPISRMGSGLAIGRAGVVVTCEHVLRPWIVQERSAAALASASDVDPTSVEIEIWRADPSDRDRRGLERAADWTTRDGTVRRLTPPHDPPESKRNYVPGRWDVAVLQILASPSSAWSALPELEIADDVPPAAEALVVVGMRQGSLVPGHTFTTIERAEKENLILQASVPGGYSGGAVFDLRGRFVGLMLARASGDSGSWCIVGRAVREILAQAERAR